MVKVNSVNEAACNGISFFSPIHSANWFALMADEATDIYN